MNMKKMMELKETLCSEVDAIAKKGDLSKDDLNSAHMLTDTIKNICKIEMYESGGHSRDGGYSQARYGRENPSESIDRLMEEARTDDEKYVLRKMRERLGDS